jgi:hypothetical protein
VYAEPTLRFTCQQGYDVFGSAGIMMEEMYLSGQRPREARCSEVLERLMCVAVREPLGTHAFCDEVLGVVSSVVMAAARPSSPSMTMQAKTSKAGRDDADQQTGSTTFPISSSTCIAISTSSPPPRSAATAGTSSTTKESMQMRVSCDASFDSDLPHIQVPKDCEALLVFSARGRFLSRYRMQLRCYGAEGYEGQRSDNGRLAPSQGPSDSASTARSKIRERKLAKS